MEQEDIAVKLESVDQGQDCEALNCLPKSEKSDIIFSLPQTRTICYNILDIFGRVTKMIGSSPAICDE